MQLVPKRKCVNAQLWCLFSSTIASSGIRADVVIFGSVAWKTYLSRFECSRNWHTCSKLDTKIIAALFIVMILSLSVHLIFMSSFMSVTHILHKESTLQNQVIIKGAPDEDPNKVPSNLHNKCRFVIKTVLLVHTTHSRQTEIQFRHLML